MKTYVSRQLAERLAEWHNTDLDTVCRILNLSIYDDIELDLQKITDNINKKLTREDGGDS